MSVHLTDSTGWDVLQDQAVYFVHVEYWLNGAGAYQLGKAIPVGHDLGSFADISFDVTLPAGLEAVNLTAFVGGCPASEATPEACALWSFLQGTAGAWHDEPRLCIWNPAVAAGGSASAYCEDGGPLTRGVVTTPLVQPVASFSWTQTGPLGEIVAPPGGTWGVIFPVHLDGSASTVGGGHAIQLYRWYFGQSLLGESTSATLDTAIPSAGPIVVTLQVVTDQGAVAQTNQPVWP